MRNGGLGEVEMAFHIAGAQATTALGDKIEHLQAHRIAQGFEYNRESRRFVAVHSWLDDRAGRAQAGRFTLDRYIDKGQWTVFLHRVVILAN